MNNAECKFCGLHTPCVAGPMGVTICAACIRLAKDIIDEQAGEESDESLASQRDYAKAQIEEYKAVSRLYQEDRNKYRGLLQRLVDAWPERARCCDGWSGPDHTPDCARAAAVAAVKGKSGGLDE